MRRYDIYHKQIEYIETDKSEFINGYYYPKVISREIWVYLGYIDGAKELSKFLRRYSLYRGYIFRIIDDRGKERFREEFPYKKSYPHWYNNPAYQTRGHRYPITKDLKRGVYVRPKRRQLDYIEWDWTWKKKGRGWKDNTKRKHQYKPIDMETSYNSPPRKPTTLVVG